MKVVKGTRGCAFCKQPALDKIDYGEFKVTKNIRAHYYCLLFSETITQSGRDNQGILGFLPSDILSELRRAKQKRCHYCKEFGATAGCANKFCNIKFHLPCGMKKMTQHNFNTFLSYCVKHRKPSNVPVRIKRTITDYQCVICLDKFQTKVDTTNVIWADCCKAEILLHLQCMKKLALSAGYFTKCPGCNNNTDFVTTIKLRGVFVPERDASWELARDAYSELYYVHETCDAEKCHCPHGRSHSASKGKWKLFLCKLCGSSGTHQVCSEVQKEFVCSVCNKVDENSVIACGHSTSVTHDLTLTADNTKHNEVSNPYLKSLESSTDTTFESNENLNTAHTNVSTSDLVWNKMLNVTEGIDMLEIDPLDDIIVVDCDDLNDSDELNTVATKVEALSRISSEVTVTASTVLNKPTTSRIGTDSSHSQPVRKVAIKSTTKLPYLKEKCSFSTKAISIGEKIINPFNEIILPKSNFGRDADSRQGRDEVLDDCVNYTSQNTNKTPPDKSKSKFSNDKERRIALKSTTKLPFVKKEITDLENSVLEKQTINSLDDDIIIIDSDDDENDTNISELSKVSKDVAMSADVISKTAPVNVNEPLNRPLLNTLTLDEPSHSRIERKVAVKSTTKLPSLKRKNIGDEGTPLEQQLNYTKPDSSASAEGARKKFRRSYVARMSTTHKSSSQLRNLIKKVHTVMGNQSLCERNNFSVERDSLADVTNPISKIQALYSEENQLHYSIPLEVDGEIEFINSPNFRVSGQEKACQEQ